jgi:hypothetical protein
MWMERESIVKLAEIWGDDSELDRELLGTSDPG